MLALVIVLMLASLVKTRLYRNWDKLWWYGPLGLLQALPLLESKGKY